MDSPIFAFDRRNRELGVCVNPALFLVLLMVFPVVSAKTFDLLLNGIVCNSKISLNFILVWRFVLTKICFCIGVFDDLH